MVISKESVKYSLSNIKKSRSRSALTIFSIFVGIMTIFIFISFGWGLYDYIQQLSSASSADKLMISAKGVSAPGLDTTFKLNESDIQAIEKTAGVYEVTGMYTKVAEVKQQDELKYTFLAAFDAKKPLIVELSNMKIEKGRELAPGEKGKVVLGYNYLKPKVIFTKAYDLNDIIKVNGVNMRIVGFFSAVGNPQDDSQIYITNEYMEELYPENLSYAAIIARVDTTNITQVISNVEKSLRKERGLKEGEEDFNVQSFEDLINSFSSALNIVIGFVILIALISVLVSAVNTANTMITAVLERYKEIGVLKSIGARNSEILKIFLFESAFLGFVAGVIGTFLGYLATFIGGKILANLGWGFLSPHYSWTLFIGCIGFATLTGAISGIIPAYRASKINPVDALRYE